MPGNITRQSILTTLRRQATKAVASLQKEIAKREKEFATLKEEAGKWASALGRQSQAARAPSAPLRARATKKPRLDWNAILTKLPAKFTVQEVVRKTHKPMNQVYAGVSRWIKDKKVRRGKGGYQKILTARPSHPRQRTVRPVPPKEPAAAAKRKASPA